MAYYYLVIDGKQQGPVGSDEVIRLIGEGRVNGQTLAFTQGMASWTQVDLIPEFHSYVSGSRPGSTPPPVPSGGGFRGRRAHEIDYEIHGAEMQFVEIGLDPGETVIAEAGGMMYMGPGIVMNTQFGDGSQENQGLMGKLLNAGKRVITGESLFMTTFTAQGRKDVAAFAAPYPGKIIPVDLAQLGGALICQKDSFLCAAKGVSIGIEFSRKLGRGLFGGEGFILQRLTGDGYAFVHAGGTIVEKQLGAGETFRVDTGCLVAFQPGVQYDIQFVGGFKNVLFGGEGLFFASLTGPGRVWLQSLPFSRLADRIYAAAPQTGGKQVGEGSVLGGLGRVLDGDNW